MIRQAIYVKRKPGAIDRSRSVPNKCTLFLKPYTTHKLTVWQNTESSNNVPSGTLSSSEGLNQ